MPLYLLFTINIVMIALYHTLTDSANNFFSSPPLSPPLTLFSLLFSLLSPLLSSPLLTSYSLSSSLSYSLFSSYFLLSLLSLLSSYPLLFIGFQGVKARIQDRLLYINPLVPQGLTQRVRKKKRKTSGVEGMIDGVTDGSIEVGDVEGLGVWSYFCLDRIRYHNRWITIIWDRDGTQYNRGKGMSVSIIIVVIHHAMSSFTSFIISQLFLYYFSKIPTVPLYLLHLFTSFNILI